MAAQPKELQLRQLINDVKLCTKTKQRFCFAFGIGAYASSGIAPLACK